MHAPDGPQSTSSTCILRDFSACTPVFLMGRHKDVKAGAGSPRPPPRRSGGPRGRSRCTASTIYLFLPSSSRRHSCSSSSVGSRSPSRRSARPPSRCSSARRTPSRRRCARRSRVCFSGSCVALFFRHLGPVCAALQEEERRGEEVEQGAHASHAGAAARRSRNGETSSKHDRGKVIREAFPREGLQPRALSSRSA